jgi:hydrogenase maturation factor
VTSAPETVPASGPGASGDSAATVDLASDLARASLALARRFFAGGTMWCCSPAWPYHSHHIAVEFVHPVIMGKRALPAVTVPPDEDLLAFLRTTARTGDMIVVVAPADDPAVAAVMRRGDAWGVETVWIGAGPRPPAGAAKHVLWLETEDPLEASEQFVRVYHLLWELAHVCFEHRGLLKPDLCLDDVCITCSDEGRPAEVVAVVSDDEVLVRTAEGRESVDTSIIDPPSPGDLLLVHAGTAIGPLNLTAPGGEGDPASGRRPGSGPRPGIRQ